MTAKAVKYVIAVILKPLTCLINESITKSVYPNHLKIAIIKPLFKKGDKDNMANYRPISILPVITKIFEKILHVRMNRFLEKNELLSKHQFGFRVGRSTGDAILSFTDYTAML